MKNILQILMAYILGIFLYHCSFTYLSIITMLILLYVIITKINPKKIIVLSCVFLFSFCRIYFLNTSFYENLNGQYGDVVGTVSSIQQNSQFYTLENFKFNDISYPFKIGIYSSQKFRLGDIVGVRGKMTVPEGKTNHSSFNKAHYLKQRAVYLLANTKMPITVQGHNESLKYKIRAAVLAYLNDIPIKDEANRELIRTLFTGEKSIDPDTHEDFNELGIAHILAISGFHIGLMYLVLTRRNRFIHRYVLQIFSLLMIWMYVYSIGFPPSALRAAIMLSLLVFAEVGGIACNRITILMSTLLIILIWNPYQLYSVGLQFSFAATFGILICDRIFSHKDGLVKAFYCTVGTYIFVLPLQIYYFNMINLSFILGNLFVVPLLSFIITLSFYAYLIVPFKTFLFIFVDILLRVLNYLILGMRTFAFSFQRPGISWIVIFAYYIVIFLVLNWRYIKSVVLKHRNYLFKIIILTTLCFQSLLIIYAPVFIHILYIGQGQAIYIDNRDENVFIDVGGSSRENRPQKLFDDYILKYGIQKIDYCFISHFDEDHFLNLDQHINNTKQILSTEYGKKMVQEFYPNHIEKYRVVEPNTKHNFKNYSLLTWYNQEADSSNNSSLVQQILVHNIRILTCGDIEEQTEKKLLDFNMVSDILVLPHHGSRTSSSLSFLKKVSPQYAFVSCGRQNSYGFPHNEVVDRLKTLNIPLFRTDQCGELLITATKLGYQIETANDSLKPEKYLLFVVYGLLLLISLNYYLKEEEYIWNSIN